MMCMSVPELWLFPLGSLPQEADRRCDFVVVDGVNVAGVESLVGGDVSTSRQDTDGDLMCCRRNEKVRQMRMCFPDWGLTKNYLGEFGQEMIDRGWEVAVTDQTVLGGSEAVGTEKCSS